MCRSDVREQQEYYSQRLSSSELLISQLEQFWLLFYFEFKDKKEISSHEMTLNMGLKSFEVNECNSIETIC